MELTNLGVLYGGNENVLPIATTLFSMHQVRTVVSVV